MDGRLTCLVCALSPLTRSDFDGLCLSCRAAVAGGLYRVTWVVTRTGVKRRVLEFATAADDILGVEYPDRADPIRYEPELLPKRWRELDRRRADAERAETVLNDVTQWG